MREIGKRYGFTYDQVQSFISRHNKKQRRISAGIALNKKGGPSKNYVDREDKVANLWGCEPPHTWTHTFL